MRGFRSFVCGGVVLLPSLLVGACASFAPQPEYRAEICRTDGGIPHIRARDRAGIGFGTLYAMAEDDVCILAEQFLTLGAARSRFLSDKLSSSRRRCS